MFNEKPVSVVLRNGVAAAYYRVPGESAAICIAARAGSSYEPDNLYGLAHLMEHMIFRGNEYMRSGELDRLIELSGGEANAFTTREVVLVCAESVSDTLPNIARYLYLAIAAERVREDELEEEKRVVASEARGYGSTPDTRIARLAMESLWGDTHLGRPIEGYPETILSITKEDLESFKASAFRPDNIAIAIVGNVSREAFMKIISHFEGLSERGSKLPEPAPVEPNPRLVREGRGLEAGYAAIAVPLPGRVDVLGDLPRLRGLTFNLEAGATSVMFRVLREERNLCYSYSAELQVTNWASTLLLVASDIDKDRLDEAIPALEDALRIASSGGFNDEEWRRGRRVLYRFMTRREAIGNMVRADALSVTTLLYGHPVTLEELDRATLESEWSYPMPKQMGRALLY